MAVEVREDLAERTERARFVSVSDPASRRARRCGVIFADAPSSFTGPFASRVHCQLLHRIPHTTHFASPTRTGATRSVIWWSGSVFDIISLYKHPYEYASGTVPPGDWIVANFV